MTQTATLERVGPNRTRDDMPPPVRDVASGLATLAEHGVVIHEQVISDEFADRLRDRMDEQAFMERKLGVGNVSGEFGANARPHIGPDGELRVADAGDLAEPIYQLMFSLPNKGDVFRELLMHPTMHAYADGHLRGSHWTTWGMNGIITRRGSAEQFLHTDTSTIPAEMLTRPVMINCFVCVSDFDLDMGPTGFVPGSHLGPPPRNDGDEWTPRTVAPASKGSMIVWDGSTWHGQTENRSDKARYAIALSFCLFALRPGENFCASIQDDVLARLSDAEKRVLGFETTMVGAMNAFGPRNANDRHHGIGSSPAFIPELHRT
jgi:hypothetical protein